MNSILAGLLTGLQTGLATEADYYGNQIKQKRQENLKRLEDELARQRQQDQFKYNVAATVLGERLKDELAPARLERDWELFKKKKDYEYQKSMELAKLNAMLKRAGGAGMGGFDKKLFDQYKARSEVIRKTIEPLIEQYSNMTEHKDETGKEINLDQFIFKHTGIWNATKKLDPMYWMMAEYAVRSDKVDPEKRLVIATELYAPWEVPFDSKSLKEYGLEPNSAKEFLRTLYDDYGRRKQWEDMTDQEKELIESIANELTPQGKDVFASAGLLPISILKEMQEDMRNQGTNIWEVNAPPAEEDETEDWADYGDIGTTTEDVTPLWEIVMEKLKKIKAQESPPPEPGLNW